MYGERILTIRADFGGTLEKTLYTVYLGGPDKGKMVFANREWKVVRDLKPLVGAVTAKHLKKYGEKLHFSWEEHTYGRNDFNGVGTGGGITQIIHKIYNLKDRLCEYYGVPTQ